jgi:hypothetical protein
VKLQVDETLTWEVKRDHAGYYIVGWLPWNRRQPGKSIIPLLTPKGDNLVPDNSTPELTPYELCMAYQLWEDFKKENNT